MNNDEIKTKKAELKKQIEQLSDKTEHPSSFRTKDKEPYVSSPEFEVDKEKLKQKVKEFNSLIESFDVASATLKKTLLFSDGMYTLKYSPQKDRWDMYIGEEYKSSDVRFSDDGETAKVYVLTRSSDTYGQLANYVYTFKTPSTPDSIVEKAKPIPCSKIIEGLAAQPTTDEEYYKKMGLVLDPVYKRWRKPTPDEYCATLKSVKKPEAKTKKGISFGKFLGKR